MAGIGPEIGLKSSLSSAGEGSPLMWSVAGLNRLILAREPIITKTAWELLDKDYNHNKVSSLTTFNKNTISFHMSVHIKTKTLLSVDLVALGVMSSIWVIRVILDFRRNPFICIFTVVYQLIFLVYELKIICKRISE